MNNGSKAGIAAVLGAVIMAPLLVLVLMLGAGGKDLTLGGCTDVGAVKVSAPGGKIAGYGATELGNAATILKAGQKLGVPAEGLLIGVMTAMGESGLKNLNYGDDLQGVRNPDGSLTCSLGLFQQQWCLEGHPWGTKADVTNPAKAADTFFKALLRLDGWERMDPDVAAHRVQGNFGPAGYTRFIPEARDVLAAITGGKVQAGTGGCSAGGVPGVMGGKDDYPWKNGPFNENNPQTMLAYRNCTDFAWWRLSQQLGIQPVSSSKLGPGNGATWGFAWSRAGWTVSKTPKVGAIIWYGAYRGQTSSYGHVAIVKEIKPDGQVVEEGYNFGLPPNGAYYTLTISPDTPSGYLYIPTKEQFQKAAM